MRPARHEFAPEQQHAEEGRFQEEGGQSFIGEQRRDHVARGVGEAAPVGAELERHDDARDHAHSERDRENLDPERRQPEVDLAAGREMRAFENGYEGRQPDRESGKQDMPTNDPAELDAGENDRIQMHGRSLRLCARRGSRDPAIFGRVRELSFILASLFEATMEIVAGARTSPGIRVNIPLFEGGIAATNDTSDGAGLTKQVRWAFSHQLRHVSC